ncbi:MAG: HTTM domain-containing protein [Polyangiales bacterium]
MSKKRKKRQRRSPKSSAASPVSSAAPSKSSGQTPRKTAGTPLSGPFAFLFGGIAPSRLDAMLRLTLMLLAFDCWVDLVPHGGRYGVGDFNVAHFGLLDALLPMPTPALYVGSLLFTGVLSFAMALSPWRPGLIALFTTYTLGWAVSMLDSYQHHYLVSLVLFSFMFFPVTKRPTEAKSAPWAVRIGGFCFVWGSYEVIGATTGLPTPLGGLASESLRGGLQGALFLYGVVSTTMLREDAGEDDTLPTKPGRLVSAWAYVSVCVTCTIVYFYTAVNKLSPDWRDGHALRRLGRSDAFTSLQERAAEGWAFLPPMEPDAFWSFMAKGAIAIQLVSALGFFLASQQDRLPLKYHSRLAIMNLGLAPLSFHLGAEAMGLEIGWFSYYMLLLVIVVFAPRPIIDASVDALGAPLRWLRRFMPKEQAGVVALAGSAVCGLLLAGVDLPGGVGAGVLLVLVGAGAFIVSRRHKASVSPAHFGVAMLLAGVCAFVSLTQTSVRYDYYRFVGGDHRRRGEAEEALAAYVLANRYVVTPWCVMVEGEEPDCYRDEADAQAVATEAGGSVRRSDRQEKEDEMRRLVEAQRGGG